MSKIKDDILKEYRSLNMKQLRSADNGLIAGVTYMDRQGRGVNQPVMMMCKDTLVTFTDEKGRTYQCFSNAAGYFVLTLPTRKYKVRTSHAMYEGAKPDVKEFSGLGWIEVQPGRTTVQDLVLSTLYVD